MAVSNSILTRCILSFVGFLSYIHALSSPQKVCVISGANKGIGKEIARLCIRKNITTILACRSDGESTAKELGTPYSVYLDLTDDESIENCREYVQNEFGKLGTGQLVSLVLLTMAD